MNLPNPYQRVEVLVDGKWLPATFYEGGSIAPNDEEESGDEVWWMDYFLLEDSFDTIPEDVHQVVELPQWRPRIEPTG